VPKDATLTTLAQNRAVLDALPFGDAQDFEDTRRGFLGSLPEVEIKNDKGRVVWSLKEYTFLAEEQAPPDLSARPPERRADATVMLERGALDRLLLRELSLADALQSASVRIEGDPAQLVELLGMLDDSSLMFEVVEPRRQA
jgi:alkyl sulfatase BDS1-like metallo-beta-lactamase superfamily hydrolase